MFQICMDCSDMLSNVLDYSRRISRMIWDDFEYSRLFPSIWIFRNVTECCGILSNSVYPHWISRIEYHMHHVTLHVTCHHHLPHPNTHIPTPTTRYPYPTTLQNGLTVNITKITASHPPPQKNSVTIPGWKDS